MGKLLHMTSSIRCDCHMVELGPQKSYRPMSGTSVFSSKIGSEQLKNDILLRPKIRFKPASHCPIKTESENTQSWFNQIKFDPIDLARTFRSHCQANFLNDSDKLPPIVRQSLTCQTTAEHIQLAFFHEVISPNNPISIRFSTQPSDLLGNGTPTLENVPLQGSCRYLLMKFKTFLRLV